MRSSRTSLAMLAALGTIAAAGAGHVVGDEARVMTQAEARVGDAKPQPAKPVRDVGSWGKVAGLMSGLYRPYRHSYQRGPGWSQAQVQRMARKRRNVMKNRRAQKRAGR